MSSNLPPGVTTSMIPGCGSDSPCGICGKHENECECPECPECGIIGCVEHLKLQDLLLRLDRADYIAHTLKGELNRRELKAGVDCPNCNNRIPADLRDNTPFWCNRCETIVTEHLEFIP